MILFDVVERRGLLVLLWVVLASGMLVAAPNAEEYRQKVNELLDQEMTADRAVQIALASNPSLQAILEDVGLAQADLAQAGLLKNPIFEASARFPDRAPNILDTEYSASMDFLDLSLRPLRRKLAGTQLEQARRRVQDAVTRLTADVKESYYTLVADRQTQGLQETIVDAAAAATELSDRQHQAGNISDLDQARQKAANSQARLDLSRTQAAQATDSERLRRLLGVTDSSRPLHLPDALPTLPEHEVAVGPLEEAAVSRRSDVAATRLEVQSTEEAIALKQRAGGLDAVLVGIDTEQNPDGSRVTGPRLQIPVPVHDRNQAALERLQAQLRQNRRRLDAALQEARSEVREGVVRLLAARRLTEYYRDELVPLREQVLKLSQEHYNAMLLGVYQLLQARQDVAAARREFILAQRDYWIACAVLERAAGGSLQP